MGTTQFDELVGKTIVSVSGCAPSSPRMQLIDSDGAVYTFFHRQDCCEDVRIFSVDGDPNDLVGQIVLAEQVSSEGEPPPREQDPWGTWTWTFYKFATRRGYVTVRWLGESNGYYGEGVDFEVTEARHHAPLQVNKAEA